MANFNSGDVELSPTIISVLDRLVNDNSSESVIAARSPLVSAAVATTSSFESFRLSISEKHDKIEAGCEKYDDQKLNWPPKQGLACWFLFHSTTFNKETASWLSHIYNRCPCNLCSVISAPVLRLVETRKE